jgi:hypothetical protein
MVLRAGLRAKLGRGAGLGGPAACLAGHVRGDDREAEKADGYTSGVFHR